MCVCITICVAACSVSVRHLTLLPYLLQMHVCSFKSWPSWRSFCIVLCIMYNNTFIYMYHMYCTFYYHMSTIPSMYVHFSVGHSSTAYTSG